MKICPKCQFHDNPLWRPRIFDTGIDITRLEDFESMNPYLAHLLVNALGRKPALVVTDGHFSYKVTRSGMVWRKENELLKYEGWSVPTDGAGTPKSAKFKKNVSKALENAAFRDYETAGSMNKSPFVGTEGIDNSEESHY